MADLASVSPQHLQHVIVGFEFTNYNTKVKPQYTDRMKFGLTVYDTGKVAYTKYRFNKGWYECAPVEFIGIIPAYYPWVRDLPCSDYLKQNIVIKVFPTFTTYAWRDDCGGGPGSLECWIMIENSVAKKSWRYQNGSSVDFTKLTQYDAELYAMPGEVFIHHWVWG